MNDSKRPLPGWQELRRKAEELLQERERQKKGSTPGRTGLDLLALIHELETHEVELEIQGEELRAAKQELEAALKRYSDLYHFAPIAYLTVDRQGLISQANFAAQEMFGAPKHKLVGKGLSQLIHVKDQRDYFAILEALSRALRNNEPEPRKKGSGELRMLRNSGTVFYASMELKPALDERGGLEGWLVALMDVTERKLAEEKLKSYADKLEKSNRELQDFAFIASHDLQEPLRKVRAFGDRLRHVHGELLGDQGLDYLQRMCKATARMQEMIDGLLDFSRVATTAKSFTHVELKEVMHQVLNDLEMQIEKAGVQVEVQDLPAIEADPNQMHRLFLNLISNSIKFRQESPPPRIQIHGTPVRLSEDPTPRAQEVLYYRVFVEDNGIGFDEKHAERIFSLFERLHGRSQYEGTGMGLAICRRIVERHKGSITAQGTPGKGATFIVTLPVKQPVED